MIHKEGNLNSRYCKAKSQSKLEVQRLVLTTIYEWCKWIKYMSKENSDLMQTRSMLRMQVLQSNPSKILHQRMDSNLVMQLMKLSTLVHINKLIFQLFFHNFSQLFFLQLFFLLSFFWHTFFIELRTRSDITLAHFFW